VSSSIYLLTDYFLHSYFDILSLVFFFQGKGGPFCEFRVRVQGERSVILESVKNPLQFVTVGEDGSPQDVRAILDKEPSRRFFVYCKV